MAPKLKVVPLPKKPPSVSAKEVEEEGEEEEEEEEEEGSDSSASSTPPPPPLQPKPLLTKNPSLPNSNGRPLPPSESSTESDTESESNPDPLPTAPTKKAPTPETSEASTESDTKAPAAKPIAPKPAPEPVTPKRAAPGPHPDTEKPAKRKRSVTPGTPSADKQTNDDEIVILEGILEYFEKGSDPFTDVAGFHEFIKGALNLDLSPLQLDGTIRKLKRRYQFNSCKERKGKNLIFRKGHQERVFKLSKRIWGNGPEAEFDKSKQGNAGRKGTLKRNSVQPKRVEKSKPKKEEKSKPKKEEKPQPTKAEKLEEKSSEVVEECLGDNEFLYSCLIESMSEDVKSSSDMGIIKKGLDLMDRSKKVALEKKWRKIKKIKMQVYTQQAGLICEEMEMIMEAVEGSNS